MTFYAWTISKPGRQDIKKVTDMAELRDVLRVLDLPGLVPPEFITIDAEVRPRHLHPQRRQHGRMVAHVDEGRWRG